MTLIPPTKHNDFQSIKRNIELLSQKTSILDTFSLTASRLVSTGAQKQLTSVSDLTNWVAGTANRITVADDGDGTVTLSGPQDIHTGATNFTVAGMTLTGLTASKLVATDADKLLTSDVESLSPTFAGVTTTGTIDASGGKVLVEDNATVAPTDESDGYIGVAVVAGEPRIYFMVEGGLYYVSNDGIAIAPVTGNPIGLLLSLTYT